VFQNPLDIANRALQLVGATRITSFSENSKAAAEVQFCYDKLRRTELERNLWQFSIGRAWLYPLNQTSMQLQVPAWGATNTYQVGSTVSYTDSYGNSGTYVSNIRENLNNPPSGADAEVSAWRPYFGPPIIQQFIPQTADETPVTYNVGDVVYMPVAPGVNWVYMSLLNGNDEVPNVPDQWTEYVSPFQFNNIYPGALSAEGQIVGQYNYGQVVQGSDGWYYMSLIDINQNNNPTSGPFPWNQFTTYAAGDTVGGISDGFIYQSLVNDNLGNNPATDSGANWENMQNYLPWTPTFEGDLGSNVWMRISGAGLAAPNISYPLGSGPAEQTWSRNVFPLPSNFLRRAPQDPTAGKISWLGAPSELMPDDYVIENGWLTSRTPYPIPLRFCADVTDVTQWPAMFCEMLAARIAAEICETLTQSREKLASIGANYAHFGTEARIVGAIITGPTELALDEYIATRI
jgi:hypothetical protein